MQLANYDPHAHFGDRKFSPEGYLINALKQGLYAFGFINPIPGELCPGVKKDYK